MSTDTAGRAGPAAVYTGRATNWPMVVLSSIAMVALVLLAAGGGGENWGATVPLAITLIAVVVNLATATNVRATAGPNGVTVHWGVVGWPRLHYDIGEIERADVVDLPWWFVSWGFWWTPRRTCCTVRPGPTLRLTLGSGRSVTVSVPHPDDAVAAIDDARPTRA